MQNNSQEQNLEKDALTRILEGACRQEPDLFLISVSSIDGFPVDSAFVHQIDIEEDKLAAISSTVMSLSISAVGNFFDDKQQATTIIESSLGNIIFIQANYQEMECVLVVVGSKKVSLGKLRFLALQTADSIALIESVEPVLMDFA